MARIKGRYVATIIVDFNYDEKDKSMLPFDEVEEHLRTGKMNSQVEDLLYDEFSADDDKVKLSVEQQYADIYRVEDETE